MPDKADCLCGRALGNEMARTSRKGDGCRVFDQVLSVFKGSFVLLFLCRI